MPNDQQKISPLPVRDPVIDQLRGFVCLGVLFLHLARGWANAHFANGELLFAFTPSVESFYLLSGYFLAYNLRVSDSQLSLKQWILRRVVRLAIPYWIVLLALFAAILARYAITAKPLPGDWWLQFLAQFFFFSDFVNGHFQTAAFGVYWSITVLFQFYILWTVLFWLLLRGFQFFDPAKAHARAIIGMNALALVVAFFSGWQAYFERWLPVGDWMLPASAVYLVTGWLVGQTVIRRFPDYAFFALMLALVTVGIVAADSRPIWTAIISLGLFAHARISPAWHRPTSLWLAALGRWSYSIYLTHPLVIFGFVTYGTYIRRDPDWTNSTLYMFAAITPCIAVGYVYYRFVEVPTMRWSSARKYRAET